MLVAFTTAAWQGQAPSRPSKRTTCMTDDALTDLIEACRAAPSSDGVLRAMIRQARETADPADAVSYLAAAEPNTGADMATRFLAGDFLMEQEAHDAALKWYRGDDPAAAVRAARALLALGRRPEAIDAYRGAVRQDEALRDGDLDRELAVAQAGGAQVINMQDRRLIDADEEAPVVMPPTETDRITFADVGGLDQVKHQINRKIILPFQKPGLFKKFRRKAGGGILLYGPPGCGKTMLARATAGECDAGFNVIRIPEILDMFIGESEKRLAQAFADARAERPTVLFFDEIEAIAARRRFDTNSNQASLVSTFLSELDGVGTDNDGLLILAATNVPWAIDSAFRRPGRFDRVVFIPPPDETARGEILKVQIKERPQAPDIALAPIAAKTSGYSGADLAGLIETATDLAIEDSLMQDTGVAPITQAHLTEALSEHKATTVEWLTTARNYAKYSNEGGLYDDVVEFLQKHTR